MSPIKSVKIIKAQIGHGGAMRPSLAVVIDPMPKNEEDIIQIGDDIKAVVQAYNRK